MAKAPAIGIDLGTSTCCVAVFQQDQVEILPNDQGNRTTPSCVAFTDSQRLIGESARGQITRNPANTIVDVKRLMGRTRDESLSSEIAKYHWPFEVVEKRPKVRVEHRGDTKVFTPEEISSMMLMKMKETAELYLGVSVSDAVVTVPACFRDSQVRATIDACTIAGLNVLRLIKEPSAAALAYSLQKRINEWQCVLIFDLGGGKLDVSVYTTKDDWIEGRSTAGSIHLGGEDFNNRLVDFFIEEFKKKFKKDMSNNKRAVRRLRSACEKAKKSLSTVTVTQIELDSLYDGIDFYTRITRQKFEELNDDLFRSILDIVEKALQDARVKKEQVDDVVLIGGSSRIPKIQELLQDFFGGKELVKSINPDEIVASGAAYQAAILSGNQSEVIQDSLVLEIASFSLGLETTNGVMTTLIKRNSTIPKKETETFQCPGDQPSVLIKIFEGEEKCTKDNCLLDKLFLPRTSASNITAKHEMSLELVPLQSTSKETTKHKHKIEVTFEIDRGGNIIVTATDQTTSKQKTLTVTNSENRLSLQDITRMAEEAKLFKAEDEREKKRLSAKNSLEGFLFAIQTAVEDVADKVPAKDCESVASKCKEVVEWLDGNPMAKKEEFEYWRQEVQRSALPLYRNPLSRNIFVSLVQQYPTSY